MLVVVMLTDEDAWTGPLFNGEFKWEMGPISFDRAYGLSWILLNNLLRMMNKKMDNNA